MTIAGRFSGLWSFALFIVFYTANGGCDAVKGADDSPIFLAQDIVPKGFEELSKPQRSLVDIYYGNRYLGSQLVTYTAKTIIFSDPARIVRKIGDISNPPLVQEAITGEIQTNSDKICSPEKDDVCGVMTPAIVSVIFDESRFRVDIFVSRDFLMTREITISKYLPPSDGGYSATQNLSAAVAGTRSSNNTANNEDYTLYGTSAIAKEENSLYGSWDYSKAQHFSVNSLYGQREFEGVSYRAGIISSEGFGLSFTPNQTLAGAHLGSSDRTRTDTGYSGGMPLDVFLSTRGRVEAYKDSRLITSYFFEAGSQQLDTSSFPSGVYDVEIKIIDDQGMVIRTETRFFAKQFGLPPEGEWLYFIEAGKVLDSNRGTVLPNETNQLLARAGVSRRLTNTLAASVSSAINKGNGLVELGIFHTGYRYEISPSVMVDSKNAYGFNVISHVYLGKLSVSAGHRQLWNKGYNQISNTSDDPALLGISFRQSSVSMSVPFFSGTANYRFSENFTENTTGAANPVIRTHAAGYHARVYRAHNLDVDMEATYSQSLEDKIAMLSFSFRLRDERWTWRTTPLAEHTWNDRGEKSSERLRTSVSWDSKSLFDSAIRADVGAEVGTGEERYDMQLEAASSWGRGGLSLNHVVAGGSTNTNYGVSFNSSFMANSEHMAIGGENISESALIINVKGSEGDVFDVAIDGQRRSYAVAGRPSLVGLAPYRQYTVSISPTSDALYEFDERERTVTLYPGNVVSLEYKATSLKLLFGRLLFKGKAVMGAAIKGGLHSANTDDYGLFQIEVPSDADAISVVLRDGKVIKLKLPEDRSEGVLSMGTVELENMEFSLSEPVQDEDLSEPVQDGDDGDDGDDNLSEALED